LLNGMQKIGGGAPCSLVEDRFFSALALQSIREKAECRTRSSVKGAWQRFDTNLAISPQLIDSE
jgi:hypothetical protein